MELNVKFKLPDGHVTEYIDCINKDVEEELQNYKVNIYKDNISIEHLQTSMDVIKIYVEETDDEISSLLHVIDLLRKYDVSDEHNYKYVYSVLQCNINEDDYDFFEVKSYRELGELYDKEIYPLDMREDYELDERDEIINEIGIDKYYRGIGEDLFEQGIKSSYGVFLEK